MLGISLFIVLTFLTLLPNVFSLSLLIPDFIEEGVSVNVRWARDNGDPQSFGIMQRSLQDFSVVDVTGVENRDGDNGGTIGMTFDTPGQILLAVIAQTSLQRGEQPVQLGGGTQLTVNPSQSPSEPSTTTEANDDAEETSSPPATSPTPSSRTTTEPPSTTSTSTTATTTSSERISFEVVQLPPATFSTSSSAALRSVPSSSPLSTSPTSISVSISPSTTPSPDSSSSNSPTGFASLSTTMRSLVISAAVVSGLILILVIFLFFLRRKRAENRKRVQMMEEIVGRQSFSAGLGGPATKYGNGGRVTSINTINSFLASDEMEGGMQMGRGGNMNGNMNIAGYGAASAGAAAAYQNHPYGFQSPPLHQPGRGPQGGGSIPPSQNPTYLPR